MAKFMFIYHGGAAPETPEEGEKVMAAWGAWLGGLGDALVDGGHPAGLSMTLTSSGVQEGGGATRSLATRWFRRKRWSKPLSLAATARFS